MVLIVGSCATDPLVVGGERGRRARGRAGPWPPAPARWSGQSGRRRHDRAHGRPFLILSSCLRDLAERSWDDLDFLGWRDHQAPDRAYLAAEQDGALVALVLRSSGTSAVHRVSSMCSLCLTTHTGGVSLLVAARTGKAGQQGNTVGAYMCRDLACSLYVRGLKHVVGLGGRIPDSLSLEDRVDRTKAKLADFIAQVTA